MYRIARNVWAFDWNVCVRVLFGIIHIGEVCVMAGMSVSGIISGINYCNVNRDV